MNDAQLLAAGESAQKKFLAYVKDSVRSDLDAVICEPPVTVAIPFSIVEKYELKVKLENSAIAGRGKAGLQDVRFFNNEAGVKDFLVKLVESTGESPTVYTECLNRIKNYKYLEKRGAGDSLLLHRSGVRAFDTKDCKACAPWGSRGWTVCQRCDNNGNVDCLSCGGYKKKACPSCHRAGGQKRYTPVYQNSVLVRTDEHWESCSPCGGFGEVDCYACLRSGKVPCHNCGGHQKLACKPCSETGEVTTVWGSTVAATHSMSYSYSSSLDKLAQEDLGKFLEKTKMLVHTDAIEEGREQDIGHGGPVFANAVVSVKHKFRTHRTSYFAKVKSKRTQIRHMGTAGILLHAGGILEELVSADLDELRAYAKSGNHGALGVSMREVLKSGVNWNIVEAIATADTYPSTKEIADAVHNAVSGVYIYSYIETMQSVISRAHRRHYLIGGLALITGVMGIVSFFAPHLICTHPTWFFADSCVGPDAYAHVQANFAKSAVEFGLVMGAAVSWLQLGVERARLNEIAKPGGKTFVQFAKKIGATHGRKTLVGNLLVGALVAYGWAHFVAHRLANS